MVGIASTEHASEDGWHSWTKCQLESSWEDARILTEARRTLFTRKAWTIVVSKIYSMRYLLDVFEDSKEAM